LIIGEMQNKLARWSSEDGERKFDRLLRLIADGTWLAEAARVTLASRGARTAGMDGIDKQRMEANLPAELARIRTELLAGTYEPLPTRRVYIPKASDKTKLRPLGIPSLRDRIVERAMLMAMQPIWESDFHRASYGFRPARSVHHAIRTVKLQLQDGGKQSVSGRWIIEGDLASYFDTVHHRLLLARARVARRHVMRVAGRSFGETRTFHPSAVHGAIPALARSQLPAPP
jgi:RNA-directed DNA polymerase